MPSEAYTMLIARIKELRANLLPDETGFSLTGDYSPAQLDRASSFRLLVHSEFEAFLEDRSRTLAMEALKSWHSRRVTVTVLCLVAYSGAEWPLPADSMSGKQHLVTTDERVQRAITLHLGRIKHNHGVKEANILRLLVPVGMSYDAFDQTWLNSMESFGAGRGDVAHTSRRVQLPIDPATEITTVEHLLQGLQNVDEQALSLLGNIAS